VVVKKTISGVTIECVKGDIASQADITAVVNAANAQLRMGGGVIFPTVMLFTAWVQSMVGISQKASSWQDVIGMHCGLQKSTV